MRRRWHSVWLSWANDVVRTSVIVAAVLLGAAGWVLLRQGGSETESAEGEDIGILETIDEGVAEVIARATGYTPEAVPMQFRAAIAKAESENGIPPGMLARLLWQESRFRPEFISGAKRSAAGAVGIAQFMPATAREWGVIATDAGSSIAGAGRYLAWLYRKTGSWSLALAAYNWGIGNVQKKGIEAAPAETQDYFTQIMQDLGMPS